MGKKNRRARHIPNKEQLEDKKCPMCESEVFKVGGTRNSQPGMWHICVNNNCPYDQFVSDSGDFTVSSFCGNGDKDKSKDVKATTYAFGYYASTGGRQCDHWRDNIKVGDYTVTVSAQTDKPRMGEVDDSVMPELGVYLAMSWQDAMSPIWGAGVKTPHSIDKYPTIYCKWPDYGAVHLTVVDWLVKAMMVSMEAGMSVDIGCQGGHGRTGCLLACLIAKVEGKGSKAAMDAVHKRHCTKAIESHSQENLIRVFCGEEPVVYKDKVQWKLWLGNYPRLSTTIVKG